MDLIPVRNAKAASSAKEFKTAEFTIPIERQQQMGVTYSEARLRQIRLDLRSVGTIEVDKAHTFDCVSRVDGYIEQLLVTSPGERVVAGQPMMTIYSGDLRAPEQEFVNLLKVQGNGSVATPWRDQAIDAARRRLKYLNISPAKCIIADKLSLPIASFSWGGDTFHHGGDRDLVPATCPSSNSSMVDCLTYPQIRVCRDPIL
jgi:Cu(I)/Ag(I) efflux system membrane fusion protein